jgi:hypothetical protein
VSLSKPFENGRGALILLFILTIVLSYPAFLHLSDQLIGGGIDAWQFPWNAFIFREQVSHGQNPYYTDYIYNPVGSSLLLHSYTEWISAIGFVLSPFLNDIAQTNIAILLSTFLSGLGAFLLARELTNNVWASLFAGIAFAFCPFRMSRLISHVNFGLTQWLPLGMWSLLRLLDTRKWKYALWTALFVAMNQYSNQYYTIYLFLTYLILLPGGLILFPQWRSKKVLLMLIGSGLLCALFLSPQIIPMFREFRESGVPSRNANLDLGIRTAARPADYVSPPLTNPLLRKIGIRSGSVLTPGLVLLVLGLAGIVQVFRFRDRKYILLILIGILFLILSFGPEVSFGGTRQFLLPYYLILKIPGVNHLRIPDRFSVMVTLTLAMTAAFLISHSRRKVVPAICCVLLLAEIFPIPFPTATYQPPPQFSKIAAMNDGTMLTLPFDFEAAASMTIRDQMIHKKKLLNGRLSRNPYPQLAYFTSVPVLQTFYSYTNPGRNPKRNFQEDQENSALFRRFFNVRYLVVYPPFSKRPRLERYLQDTFPDAKLTAEESLIRFYELPAVDENHFLYDAADTGIRFFLFENWEFRNDNPPVYENKTGYGKLLMPHMTADQNLSGIFKMRSAAPGSVLIISARGRTLSKRESNNVFESVEWSISAKELQSAHYLVQLECMDHQGNPSPFQLQSIDIKIN